MSTSAIATFGAIPQFYFHHDGYLSGMADRINQWLKKGDGFIHTEDVEGSKGAELVSKVTPTPEFRYSFKSRGRLGVVHEEDEEKGFTGTLGQLLTQHLQDGKAYYTHVTGETHEVGEWLNRMQGVYSLSRSLPIVHGLAKEFPRLPDISKLAEVMSLRAQQDKVLLRDYLISSGVPEQNLRAHRGTHFDDLDILLDHEIKVFELLKQFNLSVSYYTGDVEGHPWYGKRFARVFVGYELTVAPRVTDAP